jgi:hypothetical protein
MRKIKVKSRKTKIKTVEENTSSVNFKEKLEKKRREKEAQKKLFGSIAFAIFLLFIFGFPLSLTVDVKIGIGVALAIATIFLSYQYPRLALWLLLIYVPFTGTATYWIGQGSNIFQVSKDLLFLPALFGLIKECRRKRLPILIPQQIMPFLGILLVFCLVTLLTVNASKQMLPLCSAVEGQSIVDAQTGQLIPTPCREGQPFLQGLFGLKVLLGYSPLVFCAYYLIEDKKKLLFFGRLLVVLAIICCVLGLIQYWMLKTGRCVGTREEIGIDLFKPNLDAKCLVGGSLLYSPNYGQIRLPGTFVSPWHWSWFLVANAAISYTVAFSDASFYWRMGGLVSIVLVFINAVICGQRLAFALVPALIVILVILTGQFRNIKKFLPIGIGLALLLGIGFSFFNPDFIQERIDSFNNRWSQGPPHEFILNQLDFVLRNQKGIQRIFGFGIGTATSSARFFGDISFVETFHPKVMFEIGLLGFFLFMAFMSCLIWLTFKAYQSVKDPGLRSFASSLWVFILIITYLPYWYPLDTDPVAIYYWFFAGVILKIPKIDEQEQQKLKASPAEEVPKQKKLRLTRKRRSFA